MFVVRKPFLKDPIAAQFVVPDDMLKLMRIYPFCGGSVQELRPETNELEWEE